METTRPIGIFDSGVGGLTVLRALRELLPHEHFVYLGDTARTPYGTKGRETITRYALECERFLRSLEVKLVVVACNTVSATALTALRSASPVPVIGTVEPAAQVACEVSVTGHIAVLGTEATIRSGAYEEEIWRRSTTSPVLTSVACPLLVPLVEQGMLEGEIVQKIIELYLAPVSAAGADTAILGCTHYPLLRTEIERYLGHGVRVVDCAGAVAQEAKRIIEANRGRERGSRFYYVTDDAERFDRLATLFLGETVAARRIELPTT